MQFELLNPNADPLLLHSADFKRALVLMLSFALARHGAVIRTGERGGQVSRSSIDFDLSGELVQRALQWEHTLRRGDDGMFLIDVPRSVIKHPTARQSTIR